MIINGKEEHLELSFPCNWQYKVFTQHFEQIDTIVRSVVNDRTFTLKYSHTSKNGTYKSYEIDILVHSDDDRLALFALFKQHTDIKMVL